MSRALIVTNDSQMFLPGRGGLPRRGAAYDRLSEGERAEPLPALRMYGGRFTEVRRLWESLSDVMPTDLYIISGEHGLIASNDVIWPYDRRVETKAEVRELDDRTAFTSKVVMEIAVHDMVIVLLPRSFVSLLLEVKAFDGLLNGAAVTSPNLFDRLEKGVLLLERKGARVGRDNAERIMDHVVTFVTRSSQVDEAVP